MVIHGTEECKCRGALLHCRTEEISKVTLEDPVEYHHHWIYRTRHNRSEEEEALPRGACSNHHQFLSAIPFSLNLPSDQGSPVSLVIKDGAVTRIQLPASKRRQPAIEQQ